jgi:hypothetical protein
MRGSLGEAKDLKVPSSLPRKRIDECKSRSGMRPNLTTFRHAPESNDKLRIFWLKSYNKTPARSVMRRNEPMFRG